MNFEGRYHRTFGIKRSLPLGAILAAIFFTSSMANAADAPFYAGKTVTFIISGPPGGVPDLACRNMLQFIPDHIAGHPTVIGKNMPGAASLNAENYMGREAKPDGLTALCGVAEPANQLFKVNGLLVDLTKFHYILGDGSASVFYMRADTPPGIKDPNDFFKAQGLIFGGSTVNSGKDVGDRLLLEALGQKNYKYVTGLTGVTAGRAAIQQKFINIYAEGASSFTSVTAPSMRGEIVPIFQVGIPDDSGHLTGRSPLLPELPTFREFYQAHFGKPPAGPDIDLAEIVLGLNAVALNVILLPDGVPQPALDAMNAMVAPLNNDPDFIAAAEKLSGKGTRELPGSMVTRVYDNFLNMPPDLFALYNRMINSGTTLSKF